MIYVDHVNISINFLLGEQSWQKLITQNEKKEREWVSLSKHSYRSYVANDIAIDKKWILHYIHEADDQVLKIIRKHPRPKWLAQKSPI